MKMKFKIKGIDCANCAAELERAIQKIDGVTEASLSFMTEKLVMEIEDDRKDEVLKNLKKVVKKEEPDCTIEEI
ncbi:MAG TPA: heavy metal transporter [Clostridiales bacterium]|nr:cation transporter [Clostridium sp.]OKZ56898.1 MAG: heavy metal transporter [Clostridium sp. 26_21]HCQ54893.1 heavy metal transporter [Clostridiales bacterium]